MAIGTRSLSSEAATNNKLLQLSTRYSRFFPRSATTLLHVIFIKVGSNSSYDCGTRHLRRLILRSNCDFAAVVQMQPESMSTSPSPKPYEALLAIEFCCWVVVALAPFLRWANGAAVTTDQFVVQCALVSLAFISAISLRVFAIVRRRRNCQPETNEDSSPLDHND